MVRVRRQVTAAATLHQTVHEGAARGGHGVQPSHVSHTSAQSHTGQWSQWSQWSGGHTCIRQLPRACRVRVRSAIVPALRSQCSAVVTSPLDNRNMEANKSSVNSFSSGKDRYRYRMGFLKNYKLDIHHPDGDCTRGLGPASSCRASASTTPRPGSAAPPPSPSRPTCAGSRGTSSARRRRSTPSPAGPRPPAPRTPGRRTAAASATSPQPSTSRRTNCRLHHRYSGRFARGSLH